MGQDIARELEQGVDDIFDAFVDEVAAAGADGLRLGIQ